MKVMKAEEMVEIQKALGGFLWLKNNLHNYGGNDFLSFLKDAMEDAEIQYYKIESLLKEENENV